jgi:hypothetical protein
MSVREALEAAGADIVGEESEGGQKRLSVVQTSLNALYNLRREFESVRYVGVRGDHFVVDVCQFDHDTRENATWYGGDAGHDFYHCDGCDERLSFVV